LQQKLSVQNAENKNLADLLTELTNQKNQLEDKRKQEQKDFTLIIA